MCLVPVPEPRPVPERLGEYRILELIGRGGMGTVYRATHSRLVRDVALKVLPPGRSSDASATARFHREMAALGKFDHPNVVRATDAGEAAGIAFLVMDLVPGIDAAGSSEPRDRFQSPTPMKSRARPPSAFSISPGTGSFIAM